MEKCIQNIDFIVLLFQEDGIKRTFTKELKRSEDGRIIIPKDNCYGYKLYTKSISTEKNLLRKFFSRIKGEPEFKFEIIEDPNTYFIGEYMSLDQIAKKYGEDSSIYCNAKHYSYKGMVVSSVGKFSIYDDFCKVVPSDSVVYEDCADCDYNANK